MIRNQKEWTAVIRDALQRPESPIQQKDGIWNVVDREASWIAAGPHLFDDDLDRLRAVAVEVLREPDPQFELHPEDRFAASLHGKVLKHSRDLRRGLAESLALVGSLPGPLKNVSNGKPESTAVLAVREILQSANWVIWASVSDQLPLLAEAAPEEYMAAVEKALIGDPCPFAELYRQEQGTIMGRNYMTGILWALECLAWSDNYLVRVVAILGDLAALDPGGQWANRPSNSLVEILLPWFPQTTAPIDKRVAAVKALLKRQPAVGWRLLLELLPKTHGSSSGTHKPKWRKFVPEGWKARASKEDFQKQSEIYAKLTFDLAKEDVARLLELLKRLTNLPPVVSSELLEYLRNGAVQSLTPDQQQRIWAELMRIAARHRRFPDAAWAQPDLVPQILSVATAFTPSSPSLRYRRLFTDRDFEFFEENDTYEEQRKKLDGQRVTAAKAIYEETGFGGILEFAKGVDSWLVGRALARVDIVGLQEELLPGMLQANDDTSKKLVHGFIGNRFGHLGWPWVDSLNIQAWDRLAIIQFLLNLPFETRTWRMAEDLLGDDDVQYWQQCAVHPREAGDQLDYAIRRLLDCERPVEAVGAIAFQIREQRPFITRLAVDALLEVAESPRTTGRSVDVFEVIEVIQALQDSNETNAEDLFRIEWTYLRILTDHNDASPKHLQKCLADDPKFFTEVIRRLYRPKDEAIPPQRGPINEDQKVIAENMWHLLHSWTHPPGTRDEGPFDGEGLRAWLASVEQASKSSGHLEVAQTHLGHVLRYAPPDPDGLWIHRAAAEILDDQQRGPIREGYECEWFNSRGAYWDTRGQEELKLASDFKVKAEAAENAGFVNLATTLRGIARSYERDAERASKAQQRGGRVSLLSDGTSG